MSAPAISSAITSFAIALLFFAACAPKTSNADPSTTSDSQFHEKRDCMDAGWRFINETTRKYALENALVERPVFKYNAKLNTCICKFAVRNRNAGLELWLYDTLSNRDLAAYLAGPDGKQLSVMSKAEFDAKERELLGENLP